MKCRKCNSDVLESFRFCHLCGTVLSVELQKTNGSNVSDSTSNQCGKFTTSTISNTPPGPPSQPKTPILSFNEFRKRKSDERVQNAAKKKEKNPPKEVLIGIGIMTLTKGELKPMKGKAKMVRVSATIRKLELLKVSYEKHCAHDRNFDKEADYTLVYPDGTEILTLPDHPDHIFQLDEYQKDVGKAFNRIALFLLKRSDQELYNQLQQDNGSDTDSDSVPEKESHIRQMSVIESFARAGSTSIQTNSPSMQVSTKTSTLMSHDSIVVDNHNQGCSSSQVENDLPSGKSGFSRGFQSLKEMFPTKNECELRQAVDATGSLEGAINLLVEVQDRSVSDLYGSLLSEECEDNNDIYHDEDEPLHESKTLYTVNERLTEKLKNWKELNMDSSGNLRMKVSRQNVWEESLIKLGRAKEDVCKPIKVQFIGEPAVDQAGPSREYFGLVNSAAQERLMSQSVFKHNISALQQREYYAFGQLTALGILQGSPGPRCFSKTVVDYILTGNIEDLMPSIAEIPNHDIKTSLIELDELSNADEFREKASFESGFRFEAGYTKPFVTMSDKDEFLRCIALHYTVLVPLSELNQFVDGLKTCNILQLVREDPDMFRSLFEVSNTKLTAEDIDSIFDPQFSPVGSNKFSIEQKIIFNFNQYLEDVENGRVVSQVEEREVTLNLNQILEFATGAQDIPAVGFSPRPTIEFLHNFCAQRKISTNACANVLKFPVGELCDQKKFNEEFTFCLLNSPGFQLL